MQELRGKGGLTIGNLLKGNQALLGKWLWRFSLEKTLYGVQLLGMAEPYKFRRLV